jgi:glycosyltransferase involved in cell wall biosynthesis
MNIKDAIPVSVVIPMFNSETTITRTLNSIYKQDYPIKEIIIIDNASKDNSVDVVKKYTNARNIPRVIIIHKKNAGVGGSYNEGVKASKSSLVIFMHSDSELPGKKELQKLTEPFRKKSNEKIVATYPYVILPEKVWLTYNFWEKCLLSYAVNKRMPGLNGKFDCLDKKTFLRIGGYNTKHYGHNMLVGSDDADLHIELKRRGDVVRTDAEVVHLHYLKNDYSLGQWVFNRKLLARSYGRLIRIQNKNLASLGPGLLLFFIKPAMTLLSLLPFVYPYWIFVLFAFSLLYMPRMYTSKATITNPRIFILPIITIFLIFYETFWMIESFLYLGKKE